MIFKTKEMNKLNLLFSALIMLGLIACTPKTTKKVVDIETPSPKKSWRATAPKSGPAKPIKMGDYTEAVLDNGLRLIIVENHKLPLVNFNLVLNSPPELEVNGGVDKTGYAALAGELLSHGTQSRSKEEIDNGIESLGARLSTGDYGASGQCLTKHMDKYLEIFSDVITKPAFPQAQFEKTVKRTLSGLQSEKDNSNLIAAKVRNKVLFGDKHPYGLKSSTTSVNKITMDDVKEYYQRTFFPKNAYLIIVGDIKPEVAKEKAQAYFGQWKNPAAMPSYAPMPECNLAKQQNVHMVDRPGAVQSTINIAFPVNLKPGHEDAIKASVMNALLGGGFFSGKLMQNLREDKAYTYGARSTLDIDPYQGYFNAFADVRNEVTDSAVTEFLYEINDMRKTLIDEETLQVSKKFLAGNFARSMTNPRVLSRMALMTAKYNLPKDYYKNYIANIQKVTAADVLEMAKKYLHPDRAQIIVVGNKSKVADKLAKFDGSNNVRFYDTDGNYQKPVEAKVPAGHTAKKVLEDYIDAIGGTAKINAIKDLTTIYTADLMGQAAEFKSIWKQGGLSLQEIKSGSMLIQKSVFDGKTLSMSGMQGSKDFTSGPEFEQAKQDATLIKQMDYAKKGYTMKLEGIDKIDGQNHYKVSIEKPEGGSQTEFYNIKTGLLTKVVEVVEAQGQKVTMMRKIGDYSEAGGVLFPGKITMTGMMPMPIELNKKEIKANTGVDASVFKK